MSVFGTNAFKNIVFIFVFCSFANRQETVPPKQESHLLDLLDISLGATSISSPPLADAWGMSKPAAADPWASGAALDPWHAGGAAAAVIAHRPSGAAAIGGGAGAANVESWLSRTQSPSSGSSAESAWLQNGGGSSSNAGGAMNYMQQLEQQQHPTAVGTSNGGGADAWLGGKPPLGVDPWLNKTVAAPADPWQSPNPHTNGHGAAGVATSDGQVLDPWVGPSPTIGARPSPIGAHQSPLSDLDDFDVITNRTKSAATGTLNNNNCEL